MKITEREYNLVNITLGVLILASLSYIGLVLSRPSTPKESAKPRYNESRLSLTISPSLTTTGFNQDLGAINQSIQIANQDKSLAETGLNYKSYQLAGLVNTAIELSRRLNLTALMGSELNGATQLTTTQLASLSHSVNVLRNQLNKYLTLVNNSSVPGAFNRAYDMLNAQYPAFSVLLPRIEMIKFADDQQVNEIRLGELAAKLPTAIIAAGVQGVTTTDMYADLTTLSSDVSAGRSISLEVENSFLSAQSTITAMKTAMLRLDSAQRDIAAAFNAAQTIVNDLMR